MANGRGPGAGPATATAPHPNCVASRRMGRSKVRGSSEDRYERMAIEFHERLRYGFLKIAEQNSDRCVVLDAAKDEDHVYRDVIECVNACFSLALD